MYGRLVFSIGLFVFLSAAADTAVYRRQDDPATSSLQNLLSTMQTAIASSSTGGPATTDIPIVSMMASTTMADINTDISNPQPTLKPTPPSAING